MKKVFLLLFGLLILPTAWAAQINMSVDKTNLSLDDTLQMSLSVDGILDNGQVGIQGLENFNIVGQSSSQEIQIINGKTKAVEQKIITLQPKKGGVFDLQALGKEAGKLIKSKKIKIKVQKSLAQKTKEKLLATSPENSLNNEAENPAKNSQNLLTAPSQNSAPAQEKLEVKKLPPMPAVRHFSAFNEIFWLEFLGIIVLLGLIFRGILFIKEKVYNRRK